MTPQTDWRVDKRRRLSHLEMGVISILLAAISFFLNHAMRIGGFNISFADPVLVVILFMLLYKSRIYILRYGLIFFLGLIGVVSTTSLFITPLITGVHPEPNSVLGDLIKLLISFCYFVLGSSVARLNLQHIALKWFAIGAGAVASFGVAMEILGMRVFEDVLYYGNLRFRGLMSDPNFYAILACGAIAFFAYTSHWRFFVRFLLIAILSFSVILSGSKTGLISLIVLSAMILVTRALNSGSGAVAIIVGIIAILALVFVNEIRGSLADLAYRFSQDIPQLQRTVLLLEDNPLASISSDGSTRDSTWATGLDIIQLSPIFGVGVGMYSRVSSELYSSSSVAHNTYIQIAAEWGLVLAAVFLIWIVVLLVRASFQRPSYANRIDVFILRDMIVVLMIGSISLSLNNARMLWFFLGILACIFYTNASNNWQERTVKSLSQPIKRLFTI